MFLFQEQLAGLDLEHLNSSEDSELFKPGLINMHDYYLMDFKNDSKQHGCNGTGPKPVIQTASNAGNIIQRLRN